MTPIGERSMCERQLDLFAATGNPPARRAKPDVGRPEPAPADFDDDALIAAIPSAGIADAPALAAEAGRRGLTAAVAALEQLCLRFAGFGLERAVPEQVAALQALDLIGGPESAQAVARLLTRGIVQGPTRKLAVGIAARLDSALPAKTVLALLQDADPTARADACRCAEGWPAAISVLLDLTEDNDGTVKNSAFCALGRLGRREARPALARLLREAPSLEIIDAIPRIADEDCVIVLGRIVRTQPALADAARDALETIDHPRARQVVAALATERDQPAAGQ
jgi:HEAT repeat protein